jgi:hypothetical protein
MWLPTPGPSPPPDPVVSLAGPTTGAESRWRQELKVSKRLYEWYFGGASPLDQRLGLEETCRQRRPRSSQGAMEDAAACALPRCCGRLRGCCSAGGGDDTEVRLEATRVLDRPSGKPSRWSVAYAAKRWSGNSIGGIGSPATDTFTDLATSRSYLLAARPTSSNLQQWTGFVLSARCIGLRKTALVRELDARGSAGERCHMDVHRRLPGVRDHRPPRPQRLLHTRRLTDQHPPHLRHHGLQHRATLVSLLAHVGTAAKGEA